MEVGRKSLEPRQVQVLVQSYSGAFMMEVLRFRDCRPSISLPSLYELYPLLPTEAESNRRFLLPRLVAVLESTPAPHRVHLMLAKAWG